MRTWPLLGAAIVFAIVACTYNPKVDPTVLACVDDNGCPAGYRCVGMAGARLGMCCNQSDAAACLPLPDSSVDGVNPAEGGGFDSSLTDGVFPTEFFLPIDASTADLGFGHADEADGADLHAADTGSIDAEQPDVPLSTSGVDGSARASGGSGGTGGSGGLGGSPSAGGSSGSGGAPVLDGRPADAVFPDAGDVPIIIGTGGTGGAPGSGDSGAGLAGASGTDVPGGIGGFNGSGGVGGAGLIGNGGSAATGGIGGGGTAGNSGDTSAGGIGSTGGMGGSGGIVGMGGIFGNGGTSATGGTGSCQLCSPNSTRCNDNQMQKCDSNGCSWQNEESCVYGCLNTVRCASAGDSITARWTIQSSCLAWPTYNVFFFQYQTGSGSSSTTPLNTLGSFEGFCCPSQTFQVSCSIGLDVCMGAQSDHNSSIVWGKGPNGNRACSDCCKSCSLLMSGTTQLACN